MTTVLQLALERAKLLMMLKHPLCLSALLREIATFALGGVLINMGIRQTQDVRQCFLHVYFSGHS